MSPGPLAQRRRPHLAGDPARVVTRLFVPGHYLPGGRDETASSVVDHVLALSDEQVTQSLASVFDRFGKRHRDLGSTFRQHAARIGNRLDPGMELSDDRWLLLGATFTHEYAVEAAGLCNPSVVAAPDQTATAPGSLRFVMSVRQIGEGHRSSIGFRTGVLGGDGQIVIDDPGLFADTGTAEPSVLDRYSLRAREPGDEDAESTDWVLDRLGDRFTAADLEVRLRDLETQHDTRRDPRAAAARLRDLASRSYTTRFRATSGVSERVLYPSTAVESNGMEDARLVRLVDDDGSIRYHATYTAFDGRGISQQLLTTTDFLTFATGPMTGDAAANKGVALFPRRVDGRYAALSRRDGARNAIAFSDDLHHWPAATTIDTAREPWEAIQVGNCGPPIETPDGWLVLTHGVGPMRTYSIGAWMLDLDKPGTIIGRLGEPLLTPMSDEQDGYVPNVVYSCGALLHAETLLVPFGVGDARISFATVSLPELLAAMS